MDKRVLLASMAGLLGGAPGAAVAIQRGEEQTQGPLLGYTPSRGKGKGKHPRHSSSRFVAQDKRDARKRRNRAR